MKDKSAFETPVLIVGAGPVGLSLANELGYQGIPYALVDEGDGSVSFPAGENIFSRTMEHLRRWGIADAIRYSEVISPDFPRNIGFCTRLGGKPLAIFEGLSNRQGPELDRHSPEGGLFSPKKGFDVALRKAAQARGGDLRFGIKLASLEENADGVVVELQDVRTGAISSMRCQYLAACDGARSSIRRALGIQFRGTFGEGFNFAVYFRAVGLRERVLQTFGVDIAQMHTVNDVNRAYITTVDGRDEWRFSMYATHGAAPDPHACVRQTIGSDIAFEVIRAQPWTGHRVVAESYRRGRVFLVGDAAHLRWPKGGFGANTGIGDAIDLGWKLAAVLKGWGGSSLLESYEAERRPIAIRNTNEAANNRTFDDLIKAEALLDEEGTEAEAARERMRSQLFAYRLREFRSEGIQLGYRYRSSPICLTDEGLEPPDDHMLYKPSTFPGARAPHFWLEPKKSILDLFGLQLTLLSFQENRNLGSVVDAAERLGIPMTLHHIPSEEARSLYERKIVLVRPDGHVAWRGNEVPENPQSILERVTGRRTMT
jgi:2-polyprenyl-6-methoxyphenol hydroxylase-like FAD-dependent oxidoreductase